MNRRRKQVSVGKRPARRQKQKWNLQNFLLPNGCDATIQIVTIVIAVIGIFAVMSASMNVSASIQEIGVTNVLFKQSFMALIGIVALKLMERFFTLRFLSTDLFLKLVWAQIFLLIVPLMFTANAGAKAWIYFGSFSIQPSEFAKVMTILVMAANLGDRKAPVPRRYYTTDSFKERMMIRLKYVSTPLLIIVIFAGIILFAQSDFGSMMVLCLIALACLFVPDHPLLVFWQKSLAILAIFAFIAGYILSTPWGVGFVVNLGRLKPYQMARFESCALPFGDMFKDSMHIANSLIAQARGGLIGSGYGKSLSKYYVFPARTTDFILAITVEEVGFVGFFCIFLLYATLVYRLYSYAAKMKNEKGRMILVGTASYIAIHFVFNVGGVTAAVPLTGIPLLMISSGGTSLLSTMIAIGIAQAVIRQYKNGEIV